MPPIGSSHGRPLHQRGRLNGHACRGGLPLPRAPLPHTLNSNSGASRARGERERGFVGQRRPLTIAFQTRRHVFGGPAFAHRPGHFPGGSSAAPAPSDASSPCLLRPPRRRRRHAAGNRRRRGA
eukprot:354898-Chlamydomonas_euryale.AAC.4